MAIADGVPFRTFRPFVIGAAAYLVVLIVLLTLADRAPWADTLGPVWLVVGIVALIALAVRATWRWLAPTKSPRARRWSASDAIDAAYGLEPVFEALQARGIHVRGHGIAGRDYEATIKSAEAEIVSTSRLMKEALNHGAVDESIQFVQSLRKRCGTATPYRYSTAWNRAVTETLSADSSPDTRERIARVHAAITDNDPVMEMTREEIERSMISAVAASPSLTSRPTLAPGERIVWEVDDCEVHEVRTEFRQKGGIHAFTVPSQVFSYTAVVDTRRVESKTKAVEHRRGVAILTNRRLYIIGPAETVIEVSDISDVSFAAPDRAWIRRNGKDPLVLRAAGAWQLPAAIRTASTPA